SSYTIYDLLNEQKEKGVAVLFIGEDLDVLLSLCDKIVVLCHGEVTGVVDAKNATKEQIGLMMTGEKIEGGSADD
ncbi:MAG: ABC transporter ATP-binding protein, partial [Oscillospiraceae bacterium]